MKEAELDCLERAGIVEKATELLLLFVSPKKVGKYECVGTTGLW